MNRFIRIAVVVSALSLASVSAHAQADRPHPAVQQFFNVAPQALTADEIQRLDAVVVSGTARGSNIVLFTAVANYAVHELVPLVLSRCGAPVAARAARALGPVNSEPSLDRVGDALAAINDSLSEEMAKTPRPALLAYHCSQAAPNVLRSTGDILGSLSEAYRWKKEGINQDLDNGRFVGGEIVWVLKAVADSDVERKVVFEQAEASLRLIATTARGGAAKPSAPAKGASRK